MHLGNETFLQRKTILYLLLRSFTCRHQPLLCFVASPSLLLMLHPLPYLISKHGLCIVSFPTTVSKG